MNIILNNRQVCIDAEKLTVNELLKVKNYTFKMIVVKINKQLIKKEAYDSATIKDGDQVSVLHLISGG